MAKRTRNNFTKRSEKTRKEAHKKDSFQNFSQLVVVYILIITISTLWRGEGPDGITRICPPVLRLFHDANQRFQQKKMIEIPLKHTRSQPNAVIDSEG